MDNKGDLSKARRIVAKFDELLILLDDLSVFKYVPYKETEAIVTNLERSRTAAANVMMTLGDSSAIGTMPKVDLYKRVQEIENRNENKD